MFAVADAWPVADAGVTTSSEAEAGTVVNVPVVALSVRPEVLSSVLIPMVDVAAQAFSILIPETVITPVDGS